MTCMYGIVCTFTPVSFIAQIYNYKYIDIKGQNNRFLTECFFFSK